MSENMTMKVFVVPVKLTYKGSKPGESTVTSKMVEVEIFPEPSDSKAAKARMVSAARLAAFQSLNTSLSTASAVEIGTPTPQLSLSERIASVMEEAGKTVTAMAANEVKRAPIVQEAS